MRSAGTCSLFVLLAVVVGCGEPPRRAPIGASPGADVSPAARSAETPAGDEAIRITGVVELHGLLAKPPAEAVLFVSVKPREGEFASMPALSLRIELAALASDSADVLRVPFEVTGVHTMAGGRRSPRRFCRRRSTSRRSTTRPAGCATRSGSCGSACPSTGRRRPA